MKLFAAIALIGMTSTPALAGGPAIGSLHRHRHQTVHYEEYCYKNVERYVPGYVNKHGQWVGGYVRTKRKKVPCRGYYVPQSSPDIRYEEEHPDVGSHDDNSCIEGGILGGIAGGGIGAAASRGDGRWWAIPLGIVGGSMVGCQMDGG